MHPIEQIILYCNFNNNNGDFFGRSISHEPKDDYKKEKKKEEALTIICKGVGVAEQPT